MKTKTLLSIAIIAALPFAANATQTIVETNTPAAVGANGTVNRAATSGPYQTATIGEHDDEHIATTAYVKGAYNDAIAAVNKVDAILGAKQDFLRIIDEKGEKVPIYPDVLQSLDDVILPTDLVNGFAVKNALNALDDKQDSLFLGTADGNVASGFNLNVNVPIEESEIIDPMTQLATIQVAAEVADLQAASIVNAKRVDIYTTWDTNDTTQVQLSNVRTSGNN